jgi:hypothetical protein
VTRRHLPLFPSLLAGRSQLGTLLGCNQGILTKAYMYFSIRIRCRGFCFSCLDDHGCPRVIVNKPL